MDERFETAKANAKEFARKASDQAKRKALQIGEFVKENKELVIMCVPAVAAMVKTGQSLLRRKAEGVDTYDILKQMRLIK